MHIPKTAGMSLQGLVIRRHKKTESLFLVYDEAGLKKGFKDIPGLQTVMGHYRYGFHQFSSRPARYFTFLREPLAQVRSHYKYTHQHPEKFEALDPNVKNVLDFAKGSYGYNLQTRFIAGVDTMKGKEEEVLQLAKDNLLKYFELIGIQEQFDLSLLMLTKALGWKINYYVTENKGRAELHVPEYKNELTEILQYDIRLYNYALELFENQKKQHPELLQKLKGFQRKNRIFQQLNPYYIVLKRWLGKV